MPSVRTALLLLAALLPTLNCPSAEPAAPAEPAPMPPAPVAFTPGMDDLMTMLVAPRHAKLHYAGTQRNWELAAFQLAQLRAAFRRIADAIPSYLDRDLRETLAALMEARLKATETAIAAADTPQFTRAYAELTTACNACHTYLQHSFLVVKVPDAPAKTAFPAQDFSPSR